MNANNEYKAILETRTKKDGSGTYQVLKVMLTPDYSKDVFLEKAELALLKMNSSKDVNSVSYSDSDLQFPL